MNTASYDQFATGYYLTRTAHAISDRGRNRQPFLVHRELADGARLRVLEDLSGIAGAAGSRTIGLAVVMTALPSPAGT